MSIYQWRMTNKLDFNAHYRWNRPVKTNHVRQNSGKNVNNHCWPVWSAMARLMVSEIGIFPSNESTQSCIRLGYNFDAISCESCKAFFRRNALRIPVIISHDQTNVFLRHLCALFRVNWSVMAMTNVTWQGIITNDARNVVWRNAFD